MKQLLHKIKIALDAWYVYILLLMYDTIFGKYEELYGKYE